MLLGLWVALAQPSGPDWKSVEAETLKHFQSLIKFDTSDPPGNEKPAADYLKQILEADGIPVEVVSLEPNRPNVIALARSARARRRTATAGRRRKPRSSA